MEAALRSDFRAGFYPNRPAAWIDDPVDQANDVAADVAGCLAAIERGQHDFSYPGHDGAVWRALERLVPERELSDGADIGCETGAFPAMQIAAGIGSCTVFEVRRTQVNHARVRVRMQDLASAENVQPEFDLITCLSTIEHVGLGRYGDPLDPWGDLKLAENVRRLLRPGGVLLLSFPQGRGCVVFNKHRIYTGYRRSALFGDLRLVERIEHRRPLARLRQGVGTFLRGAGSFTHPIYLLEKAT